MFYVRITTVNEISNIDFEIVYSGDNLVAFLKAFAKLRKATISFVMSVCPSAWNSSASTGRIFMKFDI